jgi:hypothetical protein
MAKDRITPTMRKAMQNLVAGRPMMHGMPSGRSFSGGFSATILAMKRRGYLDAKGQITDTGRAAL